MDGDGRPATKAGGNVTEADYTSGSPTPHKAEQLLTKERKFDHPRKSHASVGGAALEQNIAYVKHSVGCDQVAEMELELRASGNHLRGNCPLPGHAGGTSRSFYCLKDEQGRYSKWHCHRCGVGGDVLDLWAVLRGLEHLNVAQQMHDLAEHFGVHLWRDTDMMDDEQMQIRRARIQAERKVERVLTEHYFRLWVVPAIQELPPDKRSYFTQKALEQAGLA